MSSDDSMSAVWLVLVLVLAVSALAARRIPLGLLIRSVIGWLLIGGVIYVLVLYRAELGAGLTDLKQRIGMEDQRVEGETVRIQMSGDGHFWATVELNGVRRRMLVDSGATFTSVSTETAQAAGIDTDSAAFPVVINTANGAITAQRGTADELAVGPLKTRDLTVIVAPNFGDTDVLGMNFLSRLGSWRVEGQTLVLEPAREG